MPNQLEFTGAFEKLIYSNRDSGWTVGSLSTRTHPHPVIFVGHFPHVQMGQNLRIRGVWQTHPKFGERFAVDSYDIILPSTLAGIEAYFANGFVKGIGPVLAKRLVQRFGTDALAILDRDIGALRQVSGIGPRKLAEIRASWEAGREIRELAAFLQGFGVSRAIVMKLYHSYGKRTLSVLKSNPYQAAIDVPGIGFAKADLIARQLGIPADSPFRIAAALMFALYSATQHGHLYLPQSKAISAAAELLGSVLAARIAAELDSLIAQKRLELVQLDSSEPAIYLKRNLDCERQVAREIKRLKAAQGGMQKPTLQRLARFEARVGITLSPSQKTAIAIAVREKLCVITGGPGTGKTTIIKALLYLSAHERVVLAAPTGRAAKRMQEASGCDAQTIHRLLDYDAFSNRFSRGRDNPLVADIVIIDESSMLDLFLAEALLAAIPSRCQVIFVGDANQLPPVGPGNFLHDLMGSACVAVLELREIHRQSAESLIVQNAHAFLQGKIKESKSDALSDFYLIELETPDEILQMMRRLITERIPERFGMEPGQIQVLTPMNRGPLGTHALNAQLQQWLNPASQQRRDFPFFPGDRVMQLRNNYDLEVFNGDIGEITRCDAATGEMSVDYDGHNVDYSSGREDELALAYAITVHKSQGSEYPAIIFPVVAQHAIMLQRNLIYTALTRAKRLAIFIGSRKALFIGLQKIGSTKRYSALQCHLQISKET